MKKIITITAVLMFISMAGFSQKAPIDFESGGEGASWAWTVDQNGTDPALTFITNPNKSGSNTSDMVAQFDAEKAGKNWALCFSDGIGSFTFSASNSIVKMMVHKTTKSDVAIKFEVPGGANIELKVANTKINEWEELTFDFSSQIGVTFSRIVIIPDFVARAGDNTIYLDNITFSGGVALAEPTAAAANPNYEAANVISLFADNLEDVTVNTWLTGWSSSSLKEVQIAGNDVKKYSGMDVVGIETVGANLIDISSMEDLNFDIWSPNSTKFKIKLVDFGADKGYQGGDDSEHELTFDAPAMEEWVNYHIALSDFTGLTGRENLAQILLVSEPTGTSVIYLDNFFFSKGYPTSLTEKEAFSSFNVFPNPATDAINIELTARTGTILNYTVRSINGQVILNKEVNSKVLNQTLNTTNFGTGVYFLQVNTDQGAYTHKIIID